MLLIWQIGLLENLNMTFRDAHKLTGNIVKFAELKNLPLEKLSLKRP